MRRPIIITLTLTALAALCFGRGRPGGYRTGTLSRRPARKIIQLAQPTLKGSLSFEQALAKRRSVRQFDNRPMQFAQLGQLAWAGQGITEPLRGLRTAPSAGAAYPIELYFAVPEGVFVYRPAEHSLEQTSAGDIRASLAGVPPAPCDIVVAGSSRKLSAQFREDARKYTLLEAGHVAQNIQLQAVCMGIGSVTIGGMDTRAVGRICKLPKNLEVIYVIPVGYPLTQETTPGAEATTGREQQATNQTPVATGKRAVFIIPSQDFRDDELIETKRVLEMAGVQTVIASTKRASIRGMLGNMVEATVALNRVTADDYDAIIFVGGPGVQEYFDDPVARNIARDAAGKRKVVAAISAAPTILANAGILMGRRATAFPSEQERLQQAGAIFITSAPVERDRFIITCSGPAAAPQFGRAIAQALAGG